MLRSQLDVPNNTYIKTKRALAHIILSDNSMISLDANTEIQIRINAQNTTIYQTIGNTWHRVQKLLKGSNYEVETPTSLATVRGTKFNVEVAQNKDTKILVTENTVDVGQIEYQKKKRVVKNVQAVSFDKEALVLSLERKQGVDVSNISEEKKNTRWFRQNNEIDEKLEKTFPTQILKKILLPTIKQKIDEGINKEFNEKRGALSPSKILEPSLTQFSVLKDEMRQEVKGTFIEPTEKLREEITERSDEQSIFKETEKSTERLKSVLFLMSPIPTLVKIFIK